MEEKICPVCGKIIRRNESQISVPISVEKNKFEFVCMHSCCYFSEKGQEVIEQIRKRSHYYEKIC